MQVLLFAAPTDLANLIPPISKACLHPYKVLEVSQQSLLNSSGLTDWLLRTPPVTVQQFELSRILWSAFLHADETHIFYNMSSLLWKVSPLADQCIEGLWCACSCTFYSMQPVCLPACLPACLSACLSFHVPACLLTCMSACLHACLVPYVTWTLRLCQTVPVCRELSWSHKLGQANFCLLYLSFWYLPMSSW